MLVLARPAARVAVLSVAVIALFNACTPLNNDEQYLLNSTNKLRAEHRLKPVYEYEPLTVKARAWAQTLAARGQLAHSDLRALGVDWSAAAENVGRSMSIEDIAARLASSPQHRANILNGAYLLTGIGTARAKDGTLYAVELFIKS